jgi:hypothetical protein
MREKFERLKSNENVNKQLLEADLDQAFQEDTEKDGS